METKPLGKKIGFLVNLWHNSCVVHADFRHLILHFGRCFFGSWCLSLSMHQPLQSGLTII